MNVLIVEQDADLGDIWARHLSRQHARVTVCGDQEAAIEALRTTDVQVVILNLVLKEGSALAVADFASYRCPAARLIFVSSSSFFSDGSIFGLVANASAFVPSHVQPSDLVALVEHLSPDDEHPR